LFDAATGVALKSTLSSAPLLLIDTTIHSFIKIKPSSAENEWIELIFEGGLHTFLENSRECLAVLMHTLTSVPFRSFPSVGTGAYYTKIGGNGCNLH
jgi:hypothetical protein